MMAHSTKIRVISGTSCKRCALYIAEAFVSVLLGIKGGELFFSNESALMIVVTVFAVMSGFLVALMAVVGSSDTLLRDVTSNHAVVYRKTVKGRLTRYATLFVLYLLTLIGIILLLVFPDKIAGDLRYWLHAIVFSVVNFVLIASLSLPFSIKNMYMERYDRRVRRLERSEREGKNV